MAAQAIMDMSSKCLYKLGPSCTTFAHHCQHLLNLLAASRLPSESNMALKTKLFFVIFMVALTFILTKETQGCNTGCFHVRRAPMKIESRKLLDGFKKIGVRESKSAKINGDEDLLNMGLRMVPTGPDPLHHNGGSPKKPRTTP